MCVPPVNMDKDSTNNGKAVNEFSTDKVELMLSFINLFSIWIMDLFI